MNVIVLPPRSRPLDDVESRVTAIADRIESLAEKADALLFQLKENASERREFNF